MRGRMWLGGLLALGLAGCGGDGGDTTGPPPTGSGNTVSVRNNSFSPASLSVAAGTTVTWQWVQGAATHNVTFDDGTKSGNQSEGTFARAFPSAGTFPYHCTIHGPSMSGTVTVTAPGATAGGTGGTGGTGGGGDNYGRM
jgi:plastocyanin